MTRTTTPTRSGGTTTTTAAVPIPGQENNNDEELKEGGIVEFDEEEEEYQANVLSILAGPDVGGPTLSPTHSLESVATPKRAVSTALTISTGTTTTPKRSNRRRNYNHLEDEEEDCDEGVDNDNDDYNPDANEVFQMSTTTSGGGRRGNGKTLELRLENVWRIAIVLLMVASLSILGMVISATHRWARARSPSPQVSERDPLDGNGFNSGSNVDVEMVHSMNGEGSAYGPDRGGGFHITDGFGPSFSSVAAADAPVPPTLDISVVCSPSFVQLQDGYRECRDECARAACCFVRDGSGPAVVGDGHDDKIKPRNCDNAYRDICFMYEGCATLGYDVLEFLYYYNAMPSDIQSTLSSSSNTPRIPVPAAPSNLAELCSDQNRNSPDGWIVCRDVCLVGSCCWSMDRWGNCFAENEDACKGYTKCLKHTRGEKDHDHEDEENYRIGPFEHNTGDTKHNSLDRNRFRAGESPTHEIVEPVVVVDPALKPRSEDGLTVDEVCNEERDPACWRECAARMCCLVPMGEEGSCLQERTTECEAYAACEVLLP